MTMTMSPFLLPPPAASPPPRMIALRPIAPSDRGGHTGRGPEVEAEELREEELDRLLLDGPRGRSPGEEPYRGRHGAHFEDEEEHAHPAGETPSVVGGSAAFVTQLLAEDEPEEELRDPFGDAARAYSLPEEHHPGDIIDVPNPVDVAI